MRMYADPRVVDAAGIGGHLLSPTLGDGKSRDPAAGQPRRFGDASAGSLRTRGRRWSEEPPGLLQDGVRAGLHFAQDDAFLYLPPPPAGEVEL